jgi:hypothetical protein
MNVSGEFKGSDFGRRVPPTDGLLFVILFRSDKRRSEGDGTGADIKSQL